MSEKKAAWFRVPASAAGAEVKAPGLWTEQENKKGHTMKAYHIIHPEEDLPQSGVVCTDGWAGRIETPVTVRRETPQRYECQYPDGRLKLVPKYAVRFTPNAKAATSPCAKKV